MTHEEKVLYLFELAARIAVDPKSLPATTGQYPDRVRRYYDMLETILDEKLAQLP